MLLLLALVYPMDFLISSHPSADPCHPNSSHDSCHISRLVSRRSCEQLRTRNDVPYLNRFVCFLNTCSLQLQYQKSILPWDGIIGVAGGWYSSDYLSKFLETSDSRSLRSQGLVTMMTVFEFIWCYKVLLHTGHGFSEYYFKSLSSVILRRLLTHLVYILSKTRFHHPIDQQIYRFNTFNPTLPFNQSVNPHPHTL